MIGDRRRHGGGDDVLSHLRRETDEQGRPHAVKAIVGHTIFLLIAEHCFHQPMRHHPLVPMAMRLTLRETELGGWRIPAHTVLHLPMMINKRAPRWWTDPDRYDPDRFAPPRSEQRRHPMAFHPFGSGAHKCIGMHFAEILVKAFLHCFVQAYRFTTPAGYAPQLEWVPLPKPADGVPLLLTPL